jgi:hypothetical protein
MLIPLKGSLAKLLKHGSKEQTLTQQRLKAL